MMVLPTGMSLIQPGPAELARMGTREIALAAHREQTAARLAQEAAATEQRIIRRRTSRLRRTQRQAWVVALIVAVAAGAFQLLRVVTADDKAADTFTLAGAVMVFLAVVAGALLKFRADNLAQAVEDFAALLDEADHIRVLNAIGAEQAAGRLRPGEWWTREDLEDALEHWGRAPKIPALLEPYERLGVLSHGGTLEALAATIGALDAAAIVVAKGLASGAINQARAAGESRFAWGVQEGET